MQRRLILAILLAGCLLGTRSAFGIDLLRDSCLAGRPDSCVSQSNFQGLWVYPAGEPNGHYIDCHYAPSPQPANNNTTSTMLPLRAGCLELMASDQPGSSHCDATGGGTSERNGGRLTIGFPSTIEAVKHSYLRLQYAANFPLHVDLVFRKEGDAAYESRSAGVLAASEARTVPPDGSSDWKELQFDLFSQRSRSELESSRWTGLEIQFRADPAERLPPEAKIWIKGADLLANPPDRATISPDEMEEKVIPVLTGRPRGGEGAEDDDYCYRSEGMGRTDACVLPDPAPRTVERILEDIRRNGDGRIGVLDGNGQETGRLPFYEKKGLNSLTAEEAGLPFTVFVKPPEEMDRIHPNYVPTEREVSMGRNGIHIALAQGETGSASFGVRENDPTGTRTFRVKAGDLATEAGEVFPAGALQVRKIRYLFQPDRFGITLHPQLLEPLDGPEELKPGFTRGFWLTIRAPERPGVYQTRIRLIDDRQRREIPLVVTVLPIRLAKNDKYFAIMASLRHFWRYYDPKNPSRFPGWALGADDRLAPNNYLFQMFKDIHDHGLTGAIAFEPIPRKIQDTPPVYSLEDGDEFFSQAQYKDILRDYQNAGFSADGFFAFNSFNLAMPDPAAYRGQLQAIIRFLGGAGINGPFVVRPWDEPRIGGSNTRDYFQAAARTIRALGMEAITEQTPEFQREMGVWEDGTPLVSMMGGYAGVMTSREVRWQRERGGKACLAVQFEGKKQPILPQRTLRGVWAWRAGLDGYYGWTYNNPIGSNLNPFDRGPTLAAEQDAGAVYFHPQQGFLPTLLWEVTRDGINDYRYIQTLERLMDRSSPSAPGVSAWLQRARDLLDTLRASIPEDVTEIVNHPPSPYFQTQMRALIVSLIQDHPAPRPLPVDQLRPPSPVPSRPPPWFRRYFREFRFSP